VPPKRRKQPERYMPFFLKFMEKLETAASVPPQNKHFGGL
jgi:hypothetical protein